MARQTKKLILCVAALACTPAALAMDVQRLDVRYRGDRYVVELEALLDAPAESVGAVLKDYERYPDLDARILESRREVDEDGSLRLLTRLRGCVGTLLCRSMRRVETLEETPDELIATAVPEESDVRFGRTHSHWEARADGTALTYHLEITPKFWIPPFIGRRMMIRTLREGTISLFRNVERAAREQPQAGT